MKSPRNSSRRPTGRPAERRTGVRRGARRKPAGPPSRPRGGRRTKRRGTRSGGGPGRLRTLLALGVVLLVVCAAGWVFLSVGIAQRFEGRIWQVPSRVWSDVLVLSEGDRVSPASLEARLERLGYAHGTESPARPGRFRKQGNRLDVHLRGFATPATSTEPLRVTLTFEGGREPRIAAIHATSGERRRHAVVEPELLATFFGKRHEERRPLGLAAIPERLRQSVLAAEDARFFEHPGLDLRGIARATFANVKSGGVVQGGSTISQQTVKNLYLDQRRTWWRKAREAAMALVLEGRYAKDQILEVYLNHVYFGQRGAVAICGVQAAARHYFGRDVGALSLAESATLAGMIKSPGAYDPFRHPERAVARRDQVLDALERLQWVDASTADAARAEPLRLASGGGGGLDAASHVADFVRRRLGDRFPADLLEAEGLNVYTTIDTLFQVEAERVLRDGLGRLERDYPVVARQLAERRLEGAVVVTRPASGEILALVGGRDYRASQFNRAVLARRQPGSCFKPFVFAAGFEQARANGAGLTPATMLDDSPLTLTAGGKAWKPENYDREFRGPVTARHALEQSLNVPTVRAARDVGLARVIDLAQRCGIETPLEPLPSLALGTAEVTPLELATAYGTLADGGVRAESWVIRSVTDSEGNVLEGRRMRRRRVLDAETAWLVNDVLRGVLSRGTARSAAALGYTGHAAGKTGTTDDTRDAWFVGYTPDLLALVWVGYDDSGSTGLTGASGALPIWVDLMRTTSAGRRAAFAAPRNLVIRRIDPTSGLLAVDRCPETVEERFLVGTEPVARCRLHQGRIKRWWGKVVGRRQGG